MDEKTNFYIPVYKFLQAGKDTRKSDALGAMNFARYISNRYYLMPPFFDFSRDHISTGMRLRQISISFSKWVWIFQPNERSACENETVQFQCSK